MAKKNWYYDLSWIVRVVIAIIPILSLIVHLLARITAVKGLLHLILLIVFHIILYPFLYIIDIITTLILRKLLFS